MGLGYTNLYLSKYFHLQNSLNYTKYLRIAKTKRWSKRIPIPGLQWPKDKLRLCCGFVRAQTCSRGCRSANRPYFTCLSGQLSASNVYSCHKHSYLLFNYCKIFFILIVVFILEEGTLHGSKFKGYIRYKVKTPTCFQSPKPHPYRRSISFSLQSKRVSVFIRVYKCICIYNSDNNDSLSLFLLTKCTLETVPFQYIKTFLILC